MTTPDLMDKWMAGKRLDAQAFLTNKLSKYLGHPDGQPRPQPAPRLGATSEVAISPRQI